MSYFWVTNMYLCMSSDFFSGLFFYIDVESRIDISELNVLVFRPRFGLIICSVAGNF